MTENYCPWSGSRICVRFHEQICLILIGVNLVNAQFQTLPPDSLYAAASSIRFKLDIQMWCLISFKITRFLNWDVILIYEIIANFSKVAKQFMLQLIVRPKSISLPVSGSYYKWSEISVLSLAQKAKLLKIKVRKILYTCQESLIKYWEHSSTLRSHMHT